MAQSVLDATQASLYGSAGLAGDNLVIGAAYGDWLRGEQARIARGLQKADAAVQAARHRSARSFGRNQVLNGLQDRADADALQKARRRAEQDGVPADR